MTKEKKHTKAPWSHIKHNEGAGLNGHSLIVGAEYGGGAICTTHPKSEWEEYEANAHLIAAAPDLLTALEYCAENSADIDLDYIEAVIKKAKGE